MENKKLNSQTVNKDNSITKTATVKAAVTTTKDTATTTAAIKDVKKEADPAAKDDVKAVKSVTKETDTKAAKVAQNFGSTLKLTIFQQELCRGSLPNKMNMMADEARNQLLPKFCRFLRL